MTPFLYTARRKVDCDPEKVKAATAGVGVVELDCSHCKQRILAVKPMLEDAFNAATLAGVELQLLCRQCAESEAGLPLEVQDAAAAACGGAAVITEHSFTLGLKPPRGGDA